MQNNFVHSFQCLQLKDAVPVILTKMNRESELARQLQEWTTQEMHFNLQSSHSAALDPEKLKVLCKGPGAAIWQWVTQHVKSTETVKTVNGNLAFKSKTSAPSYKVNYDVGGEQFEDTKQALLERRAALTGEITTTLRDVGHFEHEVERITAEVAETEQKYQQVKEAINNSRRKAALLTAFCVKSADNAAQYKEYVRCLQTRTATIKARAQKGLETEEYYSREAAGGESDEEEETEGKTPALEIASAKHVRESCSEIGTFLQDTLNGAFTNDKALFSKQKEPLWQKVEQVCGTFSADQILTGLLTHTVDTTAALRSLTSKVDIRRDAQKLRFKYDGGEVRDLSRQPSLYKSVHQLLQERNKEHFLSFVQCQKSVNDARNLEQSVSMVKSRIEKKLHKLFSQKSTDLKLARTLVDVEVEVDGQRAALHSLTQETEALKVVVEKSIQQRQEIFAKHHRIQEFQDITDQKQGVIQVLVKQNMNAQSRLEEQLAEISDYIGRSFVSQPSHLTGLTGKLAGTVSQEVDGFANLVLPYLMFSQIDSALKTAVMDLSIHQTSHVHIRPALSTVLDCLNFKMFQAPECILSQCVQLREDIGDILHRLDREASIASRRTEDDVVVNITELCERARESDSQQLRQTLPRLQEKISRTNQALDNCTHARQAADDLWLEPSQKCVPWVTVDDHTLQQYMDRWTVLVTSLRQQLLHKQ
ncbi:HAUS augmin-like complex subunit 5 isoform X3 [Mya arenaria]|uniref:HAUS augmin-like complex subunit 5 isoform X3 n=1 Tax=Mya arenaria TaxID=6604 RepID=UPI0022E1E099|nr:HAUS augmin-like complex subunit 5 isoform X3 [Mya arenaria]